MLLAVSFCPTAMAQILDPLPSDDASPILCCYVNATSKIQIARVTNVPDWYFERVVFPGQRLMFEAVATAMLEIHTGMMASAILSDTLRCTSLMVGSDDDRAEPEDDDASSKSAVNSAPSALSAIAE